MSAVTSIDSPSRAVDGRGQPLHEHLVAAAEPDEVRLDLDPARRREGRLGLAGAGGVVAVGEQDDPLLGVVGEQGGREPERARRCRSPT